MLQKFYLTTIISISLPPSPTTRFSIWQKRYYIQKGLEYSSHSAVMAAYGKEFAKTQTLHPKFHRNMIIAERRRETGHYGEESGVTKEEVRVSFEWAEEFIQAVKEYVNKSSST